MLLLDRVCDDGATSTSVVTHKTSSSNEGRLWKSYTMQPSHKRDVEQVRSKAQYNQTKVFLCKHLLPSALESKLSTCSDHVALLFCNHGRNAPSVPSSKEMEKVEAQ